MKDNYYYGQEGFFLDIMRESVLCVKITMIQVSTVVKIREKTKEEYVEKIYELSYGEANKIYRGSLDMEVYFFNSEKKAQDKLNKLNKLSKNGILDKKSRIFSLQIGNFYRAFLGVDKKFLQDRMEYHEKILREESQGEFNTEFIKMAIKRNKRLVKIFKQITYHFNN